MNANNELSDVLAIFGSFILVIFIFLFCKKIYWRLVYRKRYFIFPKMNTKGITNTAMTIAIATAILLLLTIISSGLLGVLFRAYPGWRVMVEGILIKIGGLVFGPIIGLFVGVSTDLLSVALTAGMFHYGYCLVATLYGLLAGIICVIRHVSKKHTMSFYLLIIGFLTFCFSVQLIYFNVVIKEPWENNTMYFELLNWKLTLTKTIVNLYLLGIYFVCLFIIILVFLKTEYHRMAYFHQLTRAKFNVFYSHYLYKKFFKNNNNIQEASDKFLKWNYNNINRYSKILIKLEHSKIKLEEYKTKNTGAGVDFVSILVCIIGGESLLSTMLTPVFDVQFSAMGLGYWLAMRLVSIIPSSLMNLAILYPTFRIVVPSVHYDYKEDTQESLDIPLIQ